ncbi:5668_t:CDS:2, partial [Cetraspora pellucida]
MDSDIIKSFKLKDLTTAELKKDLELYYKVIDKLLVTEDVINNNEILIMIHKTFSFELVVTNFEEDKKQKKSDDGFKPEELDMLCKK